MRLAESIGERYVWVDEICMVQDDQERMSRDIRSSQISSMALQASSPSSRSTWRASPTRASWPPSWPAPSCGRRPGGSPAAAGGWPHPTTSTWDLPTRSSQAGRGQGGTGPWSMFCSGEKAVGTCRCPFLGSQTTRWVWIAAVVLRTRPRQDCQRLGNSLPSQNPRPVLARKTSRGPASPQDSSMPRSGKAPRPPERAGAKHQDQARGRPLPRVWIVAPQLPGISSFLWDRHPREQCPQFHGPRGPHIRLLHIVRAGSTSPRRSAHTSRAARPSAGSTTATAGCGGSRPGTDTSGWM